MFRRTNAFAALVAIAAIALPVAGVALPLDRTKAGTLICDISEGINLIITSKKNLTCMFTPSQPGPREVYTGTISKFGLDLATAGGEMIWAVYASGKKRFGSLAGHYGGAIAAANIGANLLVGGLDRTVTLQPASVQGETGLNVAVGVAGIDLRPAR